MHGYQYLIIAQAPALRRLRQAILSRTLDWFIIDMSGLLHFSAELFLSDQIMRYSGAMFTRVNLGKSRISRGILPPKPKNLSAKARVLRPRVPGLLAVAIVLTGCATGKSVLTPEDVVDDGKRNTILFSYDMTLNVTDKHARVTDTDVVIRCADQSRIGKAPECFRVSVPLVGRRDIDGYLYYTFNGKGAQIMQLPYGVFNVDSVGHSVVVDVERYVDCFGFGFGGHRRYGSDVGFRGGFGFGGRGGFGFGGRFGFSRSCLPVAAYITAQYAGEAPSAAAIDVSPGAGCYAGHLKLEMTDGTLTDYTFDQSPTQPSAELIDSLPTEFQDPVRNRVTRPCRTG